MSLQPAIQIFALPGLPEIEPGDDLGKMIAQRVRAEDFRVLSGDVIVIAQKAVSKAEGRVVRLDAVTPSLRARAWAKEWGKDARVVELVLRESARILRMERGLIIAETCHGFVCANAGVDLSNAEEGTAILLPLDPDGSAARLRLELAAALGADVAIIISDTFGRAWRQGLVNVALGVAGLSPVVDYRGRLDGKGKPLHATIIAIADELAAAAELVMGKADRVPVAIVRGAKVEAGEGFGRDLIRPAERDLFR